jgi:hypothetical protein
MNAFKNYQLEKFSFNENDDNVDSASIESTIPKTIVTLYGIDGNTLFESSIEDIKEGEYPSWTKPFLEELGLIEIW